MPQWVKVLVNKPDNLDLMPRTCMFGRREQTPASCPLTSTYVQKINVITFYLKQTNQQFGPVGSPGLSPQY